MGFLITMSRKEARSVVATASFGAFFMFPLIIFIMSFNIDVGVAINDYHRHLRGEGGREFMTVM